MKEYDKLANEWFEKECETSHVVCIDARKAYREGFIKARTVAYSDALDAKTFTDVFAAINYAGEKEV
jgi:hypothetical protein